MSTLTIGAFIGAGAYGSVYHARWATREVAIKKFNVSRSEADVDDSIQHEIKVLESLRYRHVIQFYGITYHEERLVLVMDYAEGGSLQRAIKKNILDWATKARISQEIVRGLAYIHHERILHRDLKSGNVLLTRHMEVKLGDFGMAAVKVTSGARSSDTLKGTFRWMAPELFATRPAYSTKSDMYALGMVMWEMAANCTVPFKDQLDNFTVISLVKNGEREVIPLDTPAEYRHWVERCWEQDPADRPEAIDMITSGDVLWSDTGTDVPVTDTGTDSTSSFVTLTDSEASNLAKAPQNTCILAGSMVNHLTNDATELALQLEQHVEETTPSTPVPEEMTGENVILPFCVPSRIPGYVRGSIYIQPTPTTPPTVHNGNGFMDYTSNHRIFGQCVMGTTRGKYDGGGHYVSETNGPSLTVQHVSIDSTNARNNNRLILNCLKLEKKWKEINGVMERCLVDTHACDDAPDLYSEDFNHQYFAEKELYEIHPVIVGIYKGFYEPGEVKDDCRFLSIKHHYLEILEEFTTDFDACNNHMELDIPIVRRLVECIQRIHYHMVCHPDAKLSSSAREMGEESVGRCTLSYVAPEILCGHSIATLPVPDHDITLNNNALFLDETRLDRECIHDFDIKYACLQDFGRDAIFSDTRFVLTEPIQNKYLSLVLLCEGLDEDGKETHAMGHYRYPSADARPLIEAVGKPLPHLAGFAFDDGGSSHSDDKPFSMVLESGVRLYSTLDRYYQDLQASIRHFIGSVNASLKKLCKLPMTTIKHLECQKKTMRPQFPLSYIMHPGTKSPVCCI
ncbi:hypothetical protein BGW42_006135 [Actinomortierella wolfii]|nr:hypothetical protein BGW42_006135 [Actinomortierella wolfii]